MTNTREVIEVLMADDDADDRLMTAKAFREHRASCRLRFAEDGEELMDYLHHRGKYADAAAFPTPALILLDLNMPKKDGREALREIKSDRALRTIPVVVFTTSHSEVDVVASYGLGASSYITKPVTYQDLVEVMKNLGTYWFDTVALPGTTPGA
jgi:CheY-like chemotaxis protein